MPTVATSDALYVRSDRFARFHRVYTVLNGEIVTLCSRVVSPKQIRDESANPPAICGCCQSRMRKPYLIPAALQQLKEADDAR